jgi:hypothetical protein
VAALVAPPPLRSSLAIVVKLATSPIVALPGVQSLVRPEERAVVLQHPDRVARLGDLREAVALEVHVLQVGDQGPPGILLEEQIPHVDLPDVLLQQVEVGLEAAVQQIRLIRVPARADGGMVAAVVEDLADARHARGLAPVHLELDLDAVGGGELAAFAQ